MSDTPLLARTGGAKTGYFYNFILNSDDLGIV